MSGRGDFLLYGFKTLTAAKCKIYDGLNLILAVNPFLFAVDNRLDGLLSVF